ncbi:MAG: hypothetical protein IT291_10675 [Deltaproteobacteria bacterium]|nr:hypothetical protein [Deltaproteobacteria bacterium]
MRSTHPANNMKSNMPITELNRFLPRAYKRHVSFRQIFEANLQDEEKKNEMHELLETYERLLIKLDRETSASDLDATFQRVLDVQRQINNLLESSRLLTALNNLRL